MEEIHDDGGDSDDGLGLAATVAQESTATVISDGAAEEDGGGDSARAPKRLRKSTSSTSSVSEDGSSKRGGRRGAKGSEGVSRRSLRKVGSSEEVPTMTLDEVGDDRGNTWAVKEVAWVQHGEYAVPSPVVI